MASDSEEGVPVDLYIYDLTNGLAAVLSPSILDEQPLVIGKELDLDIGIGRQVEGVWHTAVVVYDREYFYGAGGVTSCRPGGTQLGAPRQVERVGRTQLPRQVFLDYIHQLERTTYTGAAYHLLEHNCNHFSDEVLQFVCGARVPKHILQQQHNLPPPLRLALSALLESMLPAPAPAPAPADARNHANQIAWDGGVRGERADSPEYLTLNTQIEQARAAGAELEARRSTLAEKLARRERRHQRKRNKHRDAHAHGDDDHHDDAMADGVEVETASSCAGPSGGGGGSAGSAGSAGAEGRAPAEDDTRSHPDPPIVYRDIDGAAEFEKLVSALESSGLELSAEERASVEELQQYLVGGEGSWVLGDDFLAFVARLLAADDGGVRVAVLRCLAACALRDDVSLLLHQDRRHHALLSYAHRIDTHPPQEQEALALVMCNLFSHVSSSEWLLYISEWADPAAPTAAPLSNIRVTTKVCVHALLAEGALRELGTALVHNVATKEVKTVVFDEVCVELGMALLQLLQYTPGEEHLFRALKALARLVQHHQDMPQLVRLVGPDPQAFRGTSARVDEQLDLIAQRVK